jgi:hypothetical protein
VVVVRLHERTGVFPTQTAKKKEEEEEEERSTDGGRMAQRLKAT